MIDKLVLLAGLVGVGGYIVHEISGVASIDPTVFPSTREQLQSTLVAAKTTLPRRDGDGQIKIWGVARSAKGVTLNMQYATWAPVLKCEAVITAIAADKSRVVPECGPETKSESAIARTQAQLQVPMFEEHIQATLNKRAFNRETAQRKESAAVFNNLGGMQREALKMADEEAQMMQAQSRR